MSVANKMNWNTPQEIEEVLALRRDGLSYSKIGMRMQMTTNRVLGICYREHLRIRREWGATEALSQTGMDIHTRDTRPSLPYIPGLTDTKKYTLHRP